MIIYIIWFVQALKELIDFLFYHPKVIQVEQYTQYIIFQKQK